MEEQMNEIDEIIEDTEDIPETNSYKCKIECPNCEVVESYELPKGTSVSLFKVRNKCKNCGCSLKDKPGMIF